MADKIEIVEAGKMLLLDGVAISKEDLGKRMQEVAADARIRETKPGVFKTLKRMQE